METATWTETLLHDKTLYFYERRIHRLAAITAIRSGFQNIYYVAEIDATLSGTDRPPVKIYRSLSSAQRETERSVRQYENRNARNARR
jgi:hypothetical protein